MHIGPIWRALKRSKASYALIALQIAVTMAIIVNAIAIIQERSRLMSRPSGVDEANIFYLSSNAFISETDNRELIRADLERLRATPGVVSAIATNSVPLRGGGWSMSMSHEAGAQSDGTGVAIYFADEHGIETFGLNLVAGRNFRPDEVNFSDRESNRWPPLGIVSQGMADAMFPEGGSAALGKTLYINDNDPVQIIGIVETLQAPWNGWDGVERAMLVPQIRDSAFARYVVRAEPGMRDSLMPQVEEMLARSNSNRIVDDMMTMTETRQRSYLADGARPIESSVPSAMPAELTRKFSSMK